MYESVRTLSWVHTVWKLSGLAGTSQLSISVYSSLSTMLSLLNQILTYWRTLFVQGLHAPPMWQGTQEVSTALQEVEGSV